MLHADLATARREVFDAIGLLAQADDPDWFTRELARLPFEVEVRAPDQLRNALRALGMRLRRQTKRAE